MAFSAGKPMTGRMRDDARRLGFLILIFILPAVLTSAQERPTEFNVDAFARKAFSLDGYMEFRPSFSRLNPDSPFYKLSYYDRDKSKSEGEGYFGILTDFAYRKGIFEALLEPYLDYAFSPGESGGGANLFQGYLSLTSSPSLTVYAGKKTLRWGKGYAWSPIAFLERPKNPNEPDLAREGYWMITADFTKSFGGPLKAFSLTPVVFPVSRSVNKAFGSEEGLNLAGKIYVLFLDTDIDLVILGGKSQPPKYGLDFSRNLRSNLEVHGEITVFRNAERSRIDADGRLQKERLNATSGLLGLRYLSQAETTYIMEYYHHGAGYDAPDMEAFYSFVDGSYASYLSLGDDSRLKEAAGLTSYGGFTPMTDYLFVRIMQKDPFNILYLNPAATVIFNLSDGSASWAPELIYTGFTNLELRLKASILTGGDREEFREKRNRFRLELRMRYYF